MTGDGRDETPEEIPGERLDVPTAHQVALAMPALSRGGRPDHANRDQSPGLSREAAHEGEPAQDGLRVAAVLNRAEARGVRTGRSFHGSRHTFVFV